MTDRGEEEHSEAREEEEVTRFLEGWLEVRQLIQAANFNRFQGAGLSATQFMTLNLLPGDGEGIAMGELARRMNLAAATVAKTVDSLEARAMVERVRSEGDGRVRAVRITAAGADLQNSAQGQFQAQIRGLFEAMKPAERKGLIRGLEGLVRASREEVTAEADDDLPVRRRIPRSRRR